MTDKDNQEEARESSIWHANGDGLSARDAMAMKVICIILALTAFLSMLRAGDWPGWAVFLGMVPPVIASMMVIYVAWRKVKWEQDGRDSKAPQIDP